MPRRTVPEAELAIIAAGHELRAVRAAGNTDDGAGTTGQAEQLLARGNVPDAGHAILPGCGQTAVRQKGHVIHSRQAWQV